MLSSGKGGSSGGVYLTDGIRGGMEGDEDIILTPVLPVVHGWARNTYHSVLPPLSL